MARPLKHLLLVTTEDPHNVRSWSGIPWSLRTALEDQIPTVTTFRPARPRRTPVAILLRLLFGGHRSPLWISNATLRSNARQVRREIARIHPDAVLSISSQCIALLDPAGVPLFLFSDAPYLTFSDAYAPWETAPRQLRRFAEQEASIARGLDGIFFGSEWACAEAAGLYRLSSDSTAKLHVTPLGANWTPSITREEVLNHVRIRPLDHMHLLFVGRDWERKGGPLALGIAETLHNAGQPVTLHIVGCRPSIDERATSPFVTVHGLLRQNISEENERLASLFLTSHFLLVPTLAECFGIVFAEAQAFALPPVSRAVHALPSIVADGESGMLFDADASPAVYAERMLALFLKPDQYRTMARQARARFESTLNWDHTATLIVTAIAGALEPFRETQDHQKGQ